MKRSYQDHVDPSPEVKPASSSVPPGHQPKISRKIRACKECQSRKIKCDIDQNQKQAVCARCQRLGLQCIVNKSLQTLLEDESEWKLSIEQQVRQLQEAVSDVLQKCKLPSLDSFATGTYVTPSTESQLQAGFHNQEDKTPTPSGRPQYVARSETQGSDTSPKEHPPPSVVRSGTLESDLLSPRARHAPGMTMTRENSPQPPVPGEPEGDSLVAAPMASLFEVTKLRNLRSNPNRRSYAANETDVERDFISQGKVSEAEAADLFRIFCGSQNQYLWGGVALLHDTMMSVRKSSSLLLAAILAVTALHVPGRERTFDICYAEFLALVSDSMFDRYHSLDDVRGLCIGAFWLSDVSWKLSGHAVRIATELNLHTSFSRAMRGSIEHVERARLWYFLYICDHHFSIAYGRPPVIGEDASISYHEKFLELPGITQADYRLHSQVGVFIILSRIYDTFGPDSGKELSEEDLLSLRKYNYDLDNWRVRWEPQLALNRYISSYPSRGVILHHSFAKLQLNALALRNFTPSAALSMSDERQELANLAISSAITILNMVLEEPDMRRAVVGVPLYLHTMITMAAVFLLKVQLQWRASQLNIDPVVILNLVERIVRLFNGAEASERHLVYHIARGLSKMLDKFRQGETSEVRMTHYNGHSGTPVRGLNGSVPIDASTVGWSSFDLPPQDAYGRDVMELFGLDQEYFPIGIFDALTSQMPG